MNYSTDAITTLSNILINGSHISPTYSVNLTLVFELYQINIFIDSQTILSTSMGVIIV